MPISESFKVRLKGLVDDYEIKRVEIAAKSGVDNHTLSNAFVYGIIPSSGSLVKLADFFNVSINYLLGRSDENDFIKSERNESFYDRFEKLCLDKGVSHYRVSMACGFDKSNISRWFSKKYLPEPDMLDAICEFFGVSVDYLLGRTDYRN